MKKAVAETGTVHLYADRTVRQATARDGPVGADSLCGRVGHVGPFTHLFESPSELGGVCGSCARVALARGVGSVGPATRRSGVDS